MDCNKKVGGGGGRGEDNYQIKFVNDRPIFSFWKNAFKGCFTEQGLGMAVYENRQIGVLGDFSNNLIGMELEIPPRRPDQLKSNKDQTHL